VDYVIGDGRERQVLSIGKRRSSELNTRRERARDRENLFIRKRGGAFTPSEE